MAWRVAGRRSPFNQAGKSYSPVGRKPGSWRPKISKKRLGHSYWACPTRWQKSQALGELVVKGEDVVTMERDGGMHRAASGRVLMMGGVGVVVGGPMASLVGVVYGTGAAAGGGPECVVGV